MKVKRFICMLLLRTTKSILYYCIPSYKLWSVMAEYGINGPLLKEIKNLTATQYGRRIIESMV